MKIISLKTTAMSQSHPLCPHCGEAYLYSRVRRPWWVKSFLFFLPVKRYSCNQCNKTSYILRERG